MHLQRCCKCCNWPLSKSKCYKYKTTDIPKGELGDISSRFYCVCHSSFFRFRCQFWQPSWWMGWVLTAEDKGLRQKEKSLRLIKSCNVDFMTVIYNWIKYSLTCTQRPPNTHHLVIPLLKSKRLQGQESGVLLNSNNVIIKG